MVGWRWWQWWWWLAGDAERPGTKVLKPETMFQSPAPTYKAGHSSACCSSQHYADWRIWAGGGGGGTVISLAEPASPRSWETMSWNSRWKGPEETPEVVLWPPHVCRCTHTYSTRTPTTHVCAHTDNDSQSTSRNKRDKEQEWQFGRQHD